MKLKILIFILLSWIFFSACQESSEESILLQTKTGKFEIDFKGNLIKIDAGDVNYLSSEQNSPIAQVRVDGKDYPPDSAFWDSKPGYLKLHYKEVEVTIEIEVKAKPTHITLEVIKTSPLEKIDCVLWGPYATSINHVVGEVVGVVRNTEIAIGIQALNTKTQGGPPCGDDFQEHRPMIPDSVAHDGILRVIKRPMVRFGSVAESTPFGSILQMHCWERQRGTPFFNQTKRLPYAPEIPVSYPEETIIGTKIALFVSPEKDGLETLGKIELEEGLPHPLIDGKWIKTNPMLGPVPHLCFEFDVNNIDEFIEIAKRSNIDWIYHSTPWETWGNFPLKEGMFPKGIESFKTCVEKIHNAGLKLGVHTLSTFITADDEYVTIPNKHPDLARKNGPKSQFVTRSYGKEIYFPNRKLSSEIAQNLAHIVNEANLDQICFDGLESNWSTGLGSYGRDLFMEDWYNSLEKNVTEQIIVDGSNLDNYIWHFYYGANYGEPWYGTFRESMLDYRLDMVRMQARNYLVPMLGQFFITPNNNKVEDIEWLMALSTGYGAGFSLTFGKDSSSYLQGDAHSETRRLRPPNLDAIIEVISTWQEARKANAFPVKVLEMLQDDQKDFYLETVNSNTWILFEKVNGELVKPITLNRAEGICI